MNKPKNDTLEEKPDKEKPRSAVTRLYDKIPVTFKQVDIFVKVLIGLLIALVIYGVIQGNT